MPILRIPAMLMRGGTSKGLFFCSHDLPHDPAMCHAVLMRAIGSPDPYLTQIDGLGCGTSNTSKIVIVSPSQEPDCDVDYLFGQVNIQTGRIDFSSNCGNLSSAVGAFSVMRRLLPIQEGEMQVRIWQANTQKRMIATLAVQNGWPVEEGSFHLEGVAFPASPIQLQFLDPAGAVTGKLFPTGKRLERLPHPRLGEIPVTLIDVGNPLMLLPSTAFSEKVETLPLEEWAACVEWGQAKMKLFAPPKLAVVSPSETDGTACFARILSMGKWHPAFTGTGAMALAVTAHISNTVVSTLLASPLEKGAAFRFEHPSGIDEVTPHIQRKGRQLKVVSVSMTRSARCLMSGEVHIPVPEVAVSPVEPSATAPLIEETLTPKKPRSRRRSHRRSSKKGASHGTPSSSAG